MGIVKTIFDLYGYPILKNTVPVRIYYVIRTAAMNLIKKLLFGDEFSFILH